MGDVHHHHYYGNNSDPRIADIQATVKAHTVMLTSILNREKLIMDTLDDLEKNVASETTLEDSIETLVKGLADQVAALKTNQTDSATAARLDALSQTVKARSVALQAAITNNTAQDDGSGTGAGAGSGGTGTAA